MRDLSGVVLVAGQPSDPLTITTIVTGNSIEMIKYAMLPVVTLCFHKKPWLCTSCIHNTTVPALECNAPVSRLKTAMDHRVFCVDPHYIE